MGGQGGGVLIDWIVELAVHNGYFAQSTSVPGVAQRTGATIYYVELLAQAHAQSRGAEPVFAMMPVPGEVDIVIAAELMEAGRALQRGLVSQGRTTLIASSHRDFATLEKVVPGNGIADSTSVLEAAHRHARRFLHDDFQSLARAKGSVISAALFGALAGCGELPFEDTAFQDTIRRSGLGVEASLRAFAAGLAAVRDPIRSDAPTQSPFDIAPPPLTARAGSPDVEALRQRIEREFPPVVHPMLGVGLQRVLEFQDVRYGEEYLQRVAELHALGIKAGGGEKGHIASIEAARWIAVAMAYDDVIRVADLKSRSERFTRIRAELGAGDSEIIGSTEYFHPRLQEVLGLLPAPVAQRIAQSPAISAWLERRFSKGRRVRSHTVRGQLMLAAIAGLRRWRRISLRHAEELAHLEGWLSDVKAAMRVDYALATELLRCRRLVKGYSDTHARGQDRFSRIMQAARSLRGQPQAAERVASLIKAALADPQGKQLTELINRQSTAG
jgi:indolepyruvate ferredoxin oxidoreductase beta subunit